jgi:predicted ABC-type sugar transport system permease subunit
VIAVIVGFVMNRTVFGKYLYAIGGNEKCAVVSGLDVARHKMAAYAISGLLSALVGVLYAAQYRTQSGCGHGLEARCHRGRGDRRHESSGRRRACFEDGGRRADIRIA